MASRFALPLMPQRFELDAGDAHFGVGGAAAGMQCVNDAAVRVRRTSRTRKVSAPAIREGVMTCSTRGD